jgi:hypothetical protein
VIQIGSGVEVRIIRDPDPTDFYVFDAGVGLPIDKLKCTNSFGANTRHPERRKNAEKIALDVCLNNPMRFARYYYDTLEIYPENFRDFEDKFDTAIGYGRVLSLEEYEDIRFDLKEFVLDLVEGHDFDLIDLKMIFDAENWLTRRRKDYLRKARSLKLEMLDSGHELRCCHPDCGKNEDVTIDHIIPISKGGTDELNNLQFLCRSHNSAKGNRVPEFIALAPEVPRSCDQSEC